jgi:hypothetical protein
MPKWLDQPIESQRADLPFAMLRALVNARRLVAAVTRSRAPAAPRSAGEPHEPVCCDDLA